jgi:STAS-like domain of unknown function (DUF4325)
MVTLDFSGVSTCNQSFLNDLFQDIESAGFKLAEIAIVCLETTTVKALVETERARFIQRCQLGLHNSYRSICRVSLNSQGFDSVLLHYHLGELLGAAKLLHDEEFRRCSIL